jgi:hypothetical protein
MTDTWVLRATLFISTQCSRRASEALFAAEQISNACNRAKGARSGASLRAKIGVSQRVTLPTIPGV